MNKGIIGVFAIWVCLMLITLNGLGELQPSHIIDGAFIKDAGLTLGFIIIVPYIMGRIDG